MLDHNFSDFYYHPVVNELSPAVFLFENDIIIIRFSQSSSICMIMISETESDF